MIQMTDEIPIIPKEEMETRELIRKRRKEIEIRKEEKIIGKAIQGYKFIERAIKNIYR
jgi:hypothetical protein